MSTIESPMVRKLWDLIHSYEPKAEYGGSVPDLTTELAHSYHRSYQDSPHDRGYSVSYFGDRVGLGLRRVADMACAIDITLPTPELMMKYTARFHHLAITHESSNLQVSHGIREFAGTLDGKTVFAMDTSGHAVRTYGWDPSHLWHIHVSLNRYLVNNKRILQIASVFK